MNKLGLGGGPNQLKKVQVPPLQDVNHAIAKKTTSILLKQTFSKEPK